METRAMKARWMRRLWMLAIPLVAAFAGGCGPKGEPAYVDEDADYINEAARETHVIGHDPTGFPVYGVDENGQPVYKPEKK